MYSITDWEQTGMSTTAQQVYGDRTVLITMPYIKIYRYYFPLGTSKTIFFDEIDHIIYHPQDKPDTVWGTTPHYLNNWFPLDELKGYKRGYFEIFMKENAIRPCFSPNDPETAFNVLTRLLSVQTNENQSQPETNPQPKEQKAILDPSPFKDITNEKIGIKTKNGTRKLKKIQLQLSENIDSTYQNSSQRDEIKENFLNYQLQQF